METLHFDFYNWKKCVEALNEAHRIHGDKIRLVLSEHWCTSGYWIESVDKPLTETDTAYTYKEACKLWQRVADANYWADGCVPHLIK